MRRLIYFSLIAFCLRVQGQAPRVDFHARFEPHSGVITGAGQVDPHDVKEYSRALQGRANPVIFMDYVDVHTADLPGFFADLQRKLDSLGWYAVPQIGLGMDDDKGHPYDARVAAGEYDARIEQIALLLKQVNRPVFLRIGYEFHGSWNGYTPESYVASFRKIVRALRAAGATNVAAIWCAESAALESDYMKYYPGDEFVDWWAIDLFEASSFHAAPVEAFMRDSTVHRKPVMIGESTPRHMSVLQGQKSWDGWFRPYFGFIEQHANVKAFCYINWDWAYWAKKYSPDWADWGDARLQKNDIVRKNFLRQISKPLYIRAGANAALWAK